MSDCTNNPDAIVVGIDLGTTNSSIGIPRAGRPLLVTVEGSPLLPSVVGLAPDATLLVGQAARNQAALYPERTLRSVKRRMGEEVSLPLGERQHTPVEISAMILRRLKLAAESQLGHPVRRAVITVPAYFSDAQRTATREAGEVAGFVVERVLHEPTAAALCYVGEQQAGAGGPERKLLVYDLGGGTFDVSILRQQGEVMEVLASHGDTHLGGDDFDAALQGWLQRRFEERHQLSLRDDRRALARLARLAEETKIRLSTESYVRAMEEHLVERDGRPLHLDEEVSRPDYEALIRPLLARTLDSVQTALHEAGLLARELDEVILVGGATRTPLVGELLFQALGRPARLDVDPDQAVALGATLHAARLAGQPASHILVDVTPFSFGCSYFGELDGVPSPHCYKTIIPRNSPLPIRQTEIFYTMRDGQLAVEANVFQGEALDARRNLLLGHFLVEGLDPKAEESSPILFDLRLDLDGILHVEVTEKHTGLNKGLTIENAFRKLSEDELAAARLTVADALAGLEDADREDGGDGTDGEDEGGLDAGDAADEGGRRHRPADDDEALAGSDDDLDGASRGGAAGGRPEGGPDVAWELPQPPADLSAAQRTAWSTARSLLEKAARLAPRLGQADRAELAALGDTLRLGLSHGDLTAVGRTLAELADVLFYLE